MTVDTAHQDLNRRGRQRGALILALFALLWAVAGASGMTSSGAAATVVRVAAVVMTAVAVLLAVRSGSSSTAQRPRQLPAGWYRRVGLVNVAQAVASVLAVAILIAAGAPMLIPPVVCLIVGAHFFPLARLFDQPQYWWTGASLSIVAAAGFITLAAGAGAEVSRVVVGLGAAITLWGTSLHVARRG